MTIRNVILDVDTGSDDAIAIMLALLSPEIRVQAICTSWGNVDLKDTTANTLNLVARMGKEVPVYRGVSAPLVKWQYESRNTRADIGAVIGGKKVPMHSRRLDLPESGKKPEEMPAVFYYRQALSGSREPVHIVTTGPLTGLACALSLWPELKENIGSLTIMGGGHRVYNNHYAEGNFWHDPEAARIVLDAGLMPTLVPLDATHRAIITREEIGLLRAQGNFCSRFAAGLLEQRMQVHTENQPLYLPDSATLHDAVAVAAFLDPEILSDVREVSLDIGLSGSAEGHCSFDRRESEKTPNCRFAFSADRERFIGRLIDTFSRARDIG